MVGKYEKNCNCEFCGKEFNTVNGRNGHKPYCKLNPNKKSAWNKGLDKTDERVKRQGDACSKTKQTEEYKKLHPSWNKGLDKTDERVKNNVDNMSATVRSEAHKQKVKKSILKKYNGKHFTQTDEYKINKKKCLFEKYGTDNLMDVPEIFDKISKGRYKLKSYCLPSGKEIKVQGYEPFALDILIEKYQEEDIFTDRKFVPPVYYFLNRKRRYYPDIFIKSENLIIEVKSSYTIKDNKQKNILKQKATNDLGYKHQVWLIEDGKLTKIVENLDEYYKMDRNR
jgi:hypothetical protein